MILGALFGVPSFTFPVWMEVHVHAGTEEGAVSLGPGPMGTLLDGME